jgi:hypothetical protein
MGLRTGLQLLDLLLANQRCRVRKQQLYVVTAVPEPRSKYRASLLQMK